MSDLPRENLFRAAETFRVRADDDGARTLHGHFTRFNDWTEINSIFEGRFMERIAPGAFKKTFREQRDQIRVLFQHGRDPVVGDKPLGPIRELREDDEGPYYEVELLDTSYNRDIIPGLEAGQYGASFGFQVTRQEVVEEPKRSDHNPDGIPERTIKEVRLREFGPVTFPAYAGASAGVRSLTDALILTPEQIEKLRERVVAAGGDWQRAFAAVHDTSRTIEVEVSGDTADLETSLNDDEERAPADEATPDPELVALRDRFYAARYPGRRA